MKLRVGACLLGAVVVALLLGGCGGGSASTVASTAPAKQMTKSEFVKEGNALCLEAEKRRGDVIKSASKQLEPSAKFTRTEQEVLVETALVPYKTLVQKFEHLKPPAGESKEVQTLAAALKSGVSEVQRNPGAAITSSSPFEEFDRLAAKIGLTSCRV